ncbi:MAG: serine protease [Opitutus sp.]|nr:serine protease [Opitutus sp.]
MNLSPSWKLRGSFLSAVILITGWSVGVAAQNPAPARAAKPEITPAVDPMLARVFPSIVRIEAIRLRPSDGRLTKQLIGGSGVIISAQGHLVTNCHVTEDGDFFRCYLYDGAHIEAKLIGQDALTDLAILQLDLTPRRWSYQSLHKSVREFDGRPMISSSQISTLSPMKRVAGVHHR